jgi:ferredoxin--NADP+ reductase
VTFHFGWAPVRVAGVDHVAGLVLKDTQNPDRQQSIPATSIITAIGFEGARNSICAARIYHARAPIWQRLSG